MPSPGPSQKRREPTLKPPFERSSTTASKRRATLSPSHKSRSRLNQERAPLPRIRSLDKQLQTPPRPGVFNMLDVVLSAPVKGAKRARSESSTGSTSPTQSAKKKKRTDKAVEKRRLVASRAHGHTGTPGIHGHTGTRAHEESTGTRAHGHTRNPRAHGHTGTPGIHGHTGTPGIHGHTGTQAIDRHPGTRAR